MKRVSQRRNYKEKRSARKDIVGDEKVVLHGGRYEDGKQKELSTRNRIWETTTK